MSLALLALLAACTPDDPKGGDDSADDTGPGDSGHTGTPDSGDSADSADSGADFECPELATGLLAVTTTPASPYYMVPPDDPSVPAPIIVFLGGGPGDDGSARISWEGFLDSAALTGSYWKLLPYATDGALSDEGDRVIAALQELVTCFGADADRAHLAGTSNGGRASFSLMLEAPEHFRTLLGAPGYFRNNDTDDWVAALTGKAVFNGVGELDTDWQETVYETHTTLESLGIESTYEEFPGQSHTPDADFPQDTLFEFWAAHEG